MSEETTKVRRKPARRPRRRTAGEPTREERAAAVAAADAAAWERACNDVTASILSEQLHTTGRVQIDPAMVDKAMHDRVADAKRRLDSDDHQPSTIDCSCRHEALISEGADQQAKMTGGDTHALFQLAMGVLDRYLARRN